MKQATDEKSNAHNSDRVAYYYIMIH